MTTKQERMSDQNIDDLLEMMKLHPNGTHAIISKNEPVGAWSIHADNMTSILKELQELRALLPKVRLKLQMLAGQIGFNMEDIAFSTNSHKDTQQRCALSALALLDALETEGDVSKKQKCQHPLDSILQRPPDKPWEGTCQKCGQRVVLKGVPDTEGERWL